MKKNRKIRILDLCPWINCRLFSLHRQAATQPRQHK